MAYSMKANSIILLFCFTTVNLICSKASEVQEDNNLEKVDQAMVSQPSDRHESNQSEEQVINLGTFGTLFEIAEQDMIEHLTNKLKALKESGKLAEVENQVKDRAKETVLNPRAVEGITRTTQFKSWLYDPTLTIDNEIKDEQGNIIAHAGQQVNPLQHIKLSSAMIFIDGTDSAQLEWVIQNYKTRPQDKIVLVKGSPIKLEQQFNIKLYFDQNGIITKRYGITHVPAKFVQEGNYLRITEFTVDPVQDEPVQSEVSQNEISSQAGYRGQHP